MELFLVLISFEGYFLIITIIFTGLVSCFYYLNIIQKAFIVKLEYTSKEYRDNDAQLTYFCCYLLTFIVFFLNLNLGNILSYLNFLI